MARKIIDTDVHERGPRNCTHLLPYLEPQWQKYIEEYGWKPENANPFGVPAVGGLYRADAIDENTHLGGANIDLLKKDLLEDAGITTAIMTGHLNASQLSPAWSEFKTALMSACNDWEIESWLEKDDRLFGSIHINAHDVPGAVREIERLADHPKMVQVMMYIADRAFGEPQYHPIYEAAAKHGLTIGFHQGGNTSTAFGYHRYYVEWKSLVYQGFQSQLASLIFEGVFDKFPSLHVAMIEGGFTWAPSLMWRLDQQYRQHRSEVPWVKRLPSEIIHDQVKFSTQPMEELSKEQLMKTFELMESDELICFSTDYPHFDFDSPTEAFPAGLDDGLLDKIMYGNALAFYPRLASALNE